MGSGCAGCLWSWWLQGDPVPPAGTLQSSQTREPLRREEPLEILTSCPPGPAVALPAARRRPGESQTLRGPVRVPGRETDTGLWGSPARARAAQDRWSSLKGDTLESASARRMLTCDREFLWASVFPSASGDRDSNPLPTWQFSRRPHGAMWAQCAGEGRLFPRQAVVQVLTEVRAVGDDEPLVPVLQPCGHTAGGQPSRAARPRLGSQPSSHPGQESTKIMWVCPPLMAPLPAEGRESHPHPPAGPLAWNFLVLRPRVGFLFSLPAPVWNSSPEAQSCFLLGPHQGLWAAPSRQSSRRTTCPDTLARGLGHCLPPGPRNPQEPHLSL